jgi:hypothetical protein
MWTNTHHNKLQSVQLWFSGVAVIQLPQEGGNRAYMPWNEAQSPDTYNSDAWCPHTCFYTVWRIHYHFTHPQGVPMFWQTCMFSLLRNVVWHARWKHGLVHGIRVAVSVDLTVLVFFLSRFICIISRISLGHIQHDLPSFLNSALISVSFYNLSNIDETPIQAYRCIILFISVIC